MFVARLGSVFTGTDYPEDLNEFVIYPNPANDKFILQSVSIINEIKIYNSNGEITYSHTDLKQYERNEINISFLPAGIYFVQVFHAEKFYCRKIIIQH